MRKVIRDELKYSVFGRIAVKVRLYFFRYQWIKNNKHNQTIPANYFNPVLIHVGKETYGELNVISYGINAKLTIGSYCSISNNVIFLLDVEHHIDTLSTYPFKVKTLGECKYEAFSKGDIVIDDDVWIGYGAMIMSGVHVGQGAVIAAGAIVTKDVPAYAVVGGIPAKIIKYRFDEEIRQRLIKFNISNLDEKVIKNNIEILYKPVDGHFLKRQNKE